MIDACHFIAAEHCLHENSKKIMTFQILTQKSKDTLWRTLIEPFQF
jgi:hypothetical protein